MRRHFRIVTSRHFFRLFSRRPWLDSESLTQCALKAIFGQVFRRKNRSTEQSPTFNFFMIGCLVVQRKKLIIDMQNYGFGGGKSENLAQFLWPELRFFCGKSGDCDCVYIFIYSIFFLPSLLIFVLVSHLLVFFP